MTSTFAQVLESAEKHDQEVTPYIDSTTPAGHFVALSSGEDGDKIIYLLEGEKNAPEAVVKGFVLMVFDDRDSVEIYGYAQDVQGNERSLGRLRSYRGKTESIESAFAQMV